MASPQPVSTFSLRGGLAALFTGLGALHLLVAVGRAHDWAIEGALLAAAGLVHLIGAVTVVFSRSRRLLIALVTWLAMASGALVFTRTAGYPFGPFTDYAPSLSSYEFVVLALSLVSTASLVGVLLVDMELLGKGGWRFDTLAPLAVIVAAVPGLTTTSWVDDASSLAGSAHVHGSSTLAINDAALTRDQRERLGREITRAREIALSYPTLESALDAGWTLAGESARGAGQMVVNAQRDFRNATFDVGDPHALIYATSDLDSPVVGLQYAQWLSSSDEISGFTGQENLWHLHAGTCVIAGPSGEYAVPLDEPTTGSGCQDVGGRRNDVVSYMLRVWVAPGWENPYGTFAHDHPALG